jgi:hypothetical protein
MMPVASLRGLSQTGAGLVVRRGQTHRPTNGGQDKSATFGLAHVVGRIGIFAILIYQAAIADANSMHRINTFGAIGQPANAGISNG